MLGTGNLSKDVDRHHYSCIFCWYQQETSGDKLEPEQEYGVGRREAGKGVHKEDQTQGHILTPLPGTLITVGEELETGPHQEMQKQSKKNMTD